MHWSNVPLGLVLLLNVFLAFVAPSQAQGSGGATAAFGLAAALIGAGMWTNNVPLALLGCLLGMVAPVWMGLLMTGNVNWLHITVRFAIVALCFGLWLRYRP